MKTINYYLYTLIASKLPKSYSKFGKTSKRIRYFLASRFVNSCGENVNFEKGSSFGTDLKIGNNSGIGINAELSSGVEIGNDVMMAPDVLILTSNHLFDDLGIPMIKQGNSELKKVIIEDDVWIGQRATILPGVTVKKGSIIAANAVVTKTFPEYSVIGGNPAKVIKNRKES